MFSLVKTFMAYKKFHHFLLTNFSPLRYRKIKKLTLITRLVYFVNMLAAFGEFSKEPSQSSLVLIALENFMGNIL